MFPADNAWNQDVSRRPLHPRGAQIIAQIQADGGDNLHPDFGENPDYGIPYVVVPARQPLVPITYTAYGDESDPGPFPIPLDAPVEGGGAGGDRHVLVLRQGTCDLFELFVGIRNGSGWNAALRRPLRPHVERAAPARLDERRRRRAADPARAGALRRGRRRRHPPRHPGHVQRDPARLHPPGDALGVGLDEPEPPADGDAAAAQGVVRRVAAHRAGPGDRGGDAAVRADRRRQRSNWFFQGAPSPGWDDDDLNQLKDIPGIGVRGRRHGTGRHVTDYAGRST